MALTKFPIEVTEPTVDMVLPVGTHVLELVVEDSAGLKSAPATVVVTVEKEAAAEPVIKGIEPEAGKQGQRLEAVISGENLEGATAVDFFHANTRMRDESVTAVIKEATADRVVVGVQISLDAEAGARSFTVTSPAGTAQSPAGVSFTVGEVVGEPTIKGIEPESGRPGEGLEAAIFGENLEKATAVEFIRAGRRDESIVAEIAEATPGRVVVKVQIGDAAEPGARNFRVTTPVGTAQSPAGVFFTVEGVVAAGPTIKGIEPESGRPGEGLEAAIFGENLEKTTAVEFVRAGVARLEVVRDESIKVEISEATAERVVVKVQISDAAEPGERSFRVTTPAGTAQSPAGVVFTVEGEVAGPVIKDIEPKSGKQGGRLEAVISGENLKGATAVEFVRAGVARLEVVRDDSIVAKIAEATADRIVLDLQISAAAEAGERGFIVATPIGTAQSPAGVSFTVEGEGFVTPERGVMEVSGIGEATAGKLATVGIIELTELAAAKPLFVAEALGISETHALEFVIGAKRLLGVPEVEFSGRSVEEVSGIGSALAARLAKSGITDLAEVAAMETLALAKVLETTEARADEYIKEAQRLLG